MTSQNRTALQITLSKAFLLVALCCVLAAWFTDHQRLIAMIEKENSRASRVYLADNELAESIRKELSRLFPDQSFSCDHVSNAIIARIDPALDEKIANLIAEMDQVLVENLDPVKIETLMNQNVTPLPLSLTVQPTPAQTTVR